MFKLVANSFDEVSFKHRYNDLHIEADALSKEGVHLFEGSLVLEDFKGGNYVSSFVMLFIIWLFPIVFPLSVKCF